MTMLVNNNTNTATSNTVTTPMNGSSSNNNNTTTTTAAAASRGGSNGSIKQRQSSITSLFKSSSNQDHPFTVKHSRTNSTNKKMGFNFKNPFKGNNASFQPSSSPLTSSQQQKNSYTEIEPSSQAHPSHGHHHHHHHQNSSYQKPPVLNLDTNVHNISDEEEEEEEGDQAHVRELKEEEVDDDDEDSISSASSISSVCSSHDSQSFEEDEKDYCAGGYHPTYIGEVYGEKKNYRIVRKLGWGHFSTVWLAFDTITETHVAIKIVRSAKHYTEAAIDEVKILTTINNGNDKHPGKEHIVKLLDHFTIRGPNGEHVCMVLEVLGENMLNLIKKFKKFQKVNSLQDVYGGLPLPLVKHITRQLLLATDYLHVECGLIHTDIKPENVLIEIKDVEKLLKLIDRQDRASKRKHQPAKQPKVQPPMKQKPPLHRSRKSVSKIVDSPIRSSKPLQSPLSTEEIFHRSSVVSTPILEEKLSSLKIDEEEEDEYNSAELISIKIADLGNACWNNLHYTDDVQTRQYRSPEIILGGDWGCSTDVWSLGCLIFELITSDYLFDPKNGPNYDKDDDHLAQIIELLDEWPSEEFIKNCEYAKKFISTSSNPMKLKRIKNLKIWTLDNVLMEKYHLNIRNSFEISRFIKCFLKIEPWQRMDCGSLLNHEWLRSDVQQLDRKFGTKGEYIRGWSSLVT